MSTGHKNDEKQLEIQISKNWHPREKLAKTNDPIHRKFSKTKIVNSGNSSLKTLKHNENNCV